MLEREARYALDGRVQVDDTDPGNLKTAIAGTCQAFAFSKHAHRYLAEFAHRLCRRFDLARFDTAADRRRRRHQAPSRTLPAVG